MKSDMSYDDLKALMRAEGVDCLSPIEGHLGEIAGWQIVDALRIGDCQEVAFLKDEAEARSMMAAMEARWAETAEFRDLKERGLFPYGNIVKRHERFEIIAVHFGVYPVPN